MKVRGFANPSKLNTAKKLLLNRSLLYNPEMSHSPEMSHLTRNVTFLSRNVAGNMSHHFNVFYATCRNILLSK